MIGEWINHLWQSTLFACAAGLLTLAFRKNLAQVRYWLWLSASMKFLIPFALLMGFGSRLEWVPARQAAAAAAQPAVSFTVVEISRPFPSAPRRAPSRRGDWTPVGLAGLWACGCAAVAALRWRGWRKVRQAVRASAPAPIPAVVEVRSCPGLLEPGVVGVLRPRLLLPQGIVERLTPAQLESVVAHELCHVRRRDNLTAAIHMAVEAMFWFHPMVWWIGARLVEERERACDEAVMRQGGDPRDYAEAIVSVCRWYVESPLACMAGVTGADIKKRLEAIMTGRIGQGLNGAKRLLLASAAVAAVAAPVTIGLLIGVGNAPSIRAQAASAAARVAALAGAASPAAQAEEAVASAPSESSTPAVAPLAARPAEAEVPAGFAPEAGRSEGSAAAQTKPCEIHYGETENTPEARRAEEECRAVLAVYPNGQAAAALQQLEKVIQQNSSPDGQALLPHPPKPQGISQEEYERRLEYAIAHFSRKSGNRTLLNPMGLMYVKYGPPDAIDDRGGDPQDLSQIWRYNYLADFGSAAEFELATRNGVPQGARINWPKPSATFVGVGEIPVPVLAQEVARGDGPPQGQWFAGLPGQRISMDVYPADEYRVLNVPLDGLSGPVRVVGRVFTMLDGVPKLAATFVDEFAEAQGMVARMNFTLEPGSYVCEVVAREQSTARMFGEKIEFQVK